jgi:hypothetical protein
LQEEDFDGPDFAFLKPWHKLQLIELVRDSTAHSLSPVLRDDIHLSVASTDSVAGDTDSERGDDAGDIFDDVVSKHPGNPEDFQGHHHEWSYCMLVWMRFAKDAYFDSN